MPRPRPTTDQRQHIIRCDDKLWKKIATAATKAGVPINVYLNRVLNAAMQGPGGAAVGGSTGSPFVAAGVEPTQKAPMAAPKATKSAKAVERIIKEGVGPLPSTVGVSPVTTAAARVIPPNATPAQVTSIIPAVATPRPFLGPITKESQLHRSPKSGSAKQIGKR